MLRRTGFHRSAMDWPSHQERQDERNARMARMVESVARAAKPAVSYGGSTTGPRPKENVLESPAYEAAVRNLGRCMRCGRTCRPQFCHRDEGKGQGIKTDVREGWAGCGYWSPQDPGCHYIVGTSGTLTKEERRAEDLRLGAITRAAVIAAGTWPKNLPMWKETTA